MIRVITSPAAPVPRPTITRIMPDTHREASFTATTTTFLLPPARCRSVTARRGPRIVLIAGDTRYRRPPEARELVWRMPLLHTTPPAPSPYFAPDGGVDTLIK